MFFVSVMYPAGPKFDLGYYIDKHMKLVHERWDKLGLTGAYVLKGTGSPSGGPAFQVMATLTWESAQAFQNAFGAPGREIMDDIKNFTEAQPVVQFSEHASA
jgi:uncharacterized protein (TIGR02118 family)